MSRLSGTIRRLANAECPVERRSGSYVDGRWVAGAPERFSVLASVQPLGGASLLRLSEGQRSREQIVVFTETALRIADASTAIPADLVTWRGHQYEVQTVEGWDSFWRCVAAKVGQ